MLTIAAIAAVIVAMGFGPYITLDGFIRQPDQNYDYIIGENPYTILLFCFFLRRFLFWTFFGIRWEQHCSRRPPWPLAV